MAYIVIRPFTHNPADINRERPLYQMADYRWTNDRKEAEEFQDLNEAQERCRKANIGRRSLGGSLDRDHAMVREVAS